MIERTLERIGKKAVEDPEWWTEERKLVINGYLWALKHFIDEGHPFEMAVKLTCEEIMSESEK